MEQPTLLFTRLHKHPRVLYRPTRNNPPERNTTPTEQHVPNISAQLRCVAECGLYYPLRGICRTGHNIITDFNLLSPILSGLRLPRL